MFRHKVEIETSSRHLQMSLMLEIEKQQSKTVHMYGEFLRVETMVNR